MQQYIEVVYSKKMDQRVLQQKYKSLFASRKLYGLGGVSFFWLIQLVGLSFLLIATALTATEKIWGPVEMEDEASNAAFETVWSGDETTGGLGGGSAIVNSDGAESGPASNSSKNLKSKQNAKIMKKLGLSSNTTEAINTALSLAAVLKLIHHVDCKNNVLYWRNATTSTSAGEKTLDDFNKLNISANTTNVLSKITENKSCWTYQTLNPDGTVRESPNYDPDSAIILRSLGDTEFPYLHDMLLDSLKAYLVTPNFFRTEDEENAYCSLWDAAHEKNMGGKVLSDILEVLKSSKIIRIFTGKTIKKR